MRLSYKNPQRSETIIMRNLALWDETLVKSPWRLLQKVALQVDQTACRETEETLRRAMPQLNESGKLFIMESPVGFK